MGKSTTARVLQALLARWSPRPKVDLVTTDGFLYPKAVLEREGLMQKKGFPESYDRARLLSFLSDVKAGRSPVRAPVYSHVTYDIVPNQWQEVDQPDILNVEGVNVLQTAPLPHHGKAVPVVSDFFDFSVYIDADVSVCCAIGTCNAFWPFATPRSTIQGPTSIVIRCCRTMKRSPPQRRSGSAQISLILRKISCRRGRARR